MNILLLLFCKTELQQDCQVVKMDWKMQITLEIITNDTFLIGQVQQVPAETVEEISGL